MSEYTEDEIKALKEKGKKLDIKGYQNMKPETLVAKIAEVESAPNSDLEAKVEALEARMDTLTAEADKRMSALEGGSENAPPKEVGAKEDPDQWIYHKNDRAGKVVSAKEAKRLKKDGWVDHLKDLPEQD